MKEDIKKILTLEEVCKTEGFVEYTDGIYQYTENNKIRLIYKEKDWTEGVDVAFILKAMICHDKLCFVFAKNNGTHGVVYNGKEYLQDDLEAVVCCYEDYIEYNTQEETGLRLVFANLK
jgi:hypothetical protein